MSLRLATLPLLTAGLFAAEPFPAVFNTEKGSPMPAEEAARTMQLPPGFKCVVFAEEMLYGHLRKPGTGPGAANNDKQGKNKQ